MICRKSLHRHTGTFHQRPQSQIICAFQHLQTLFYKNTVLSDQIHNISDCRNCHILHQIIHIFDIFSTRAEQRLDQFICNSCSTQFFEWICTCLLFWINHCISGRQNISFFTFYLLIRNLMMICHYDRHPKTLSIRNLFSCRNSIITGDDCINIIVKCTINQISVQAISILHAVRYIDISFSSKILDSFQ